MTQQKKKWNTFEFSQSLSLIAVLINRMFFINVYFISIEINLYHLFLF